MIATHTPGPWKHCTCGKCGLVWDAAGSFNIAYANISWGDDPDHPDGTMDEPQRQANLRLIAAAPEFMGLLKDAAMQLDRLEGDNLAVYARTFSALARAAIRKAKGHY